MHLQFEVREFMSCHILGTESLQSFWSVQILNLINQVQWVLKWLAEGFGGRGFFRLVAYLLPMLGRQRVVWNIVWKKISHKVPYLPSSPSPPVRATLTSVCIHQERLALDQSYGEGFIFYNNGGGRLPQFFAMGFLLFGYWSWGKSTDSLFLKCFFLISWLTHVKYVFIYRKNKIFFILFITKSTC